MIRGRQRRLSGAVLNAIGEWSAVNLPHGEYRMRFGSLIPERADREEVIRNFLAQGQLYEPDVAAVFTRAISTGGCRAGCRGECRAFSVLASRLVGAGGARGSRSSRDRTMCGGLV